MRRFGLSDLLAFILFAAAAVVAAGSIAMLAGCRASAPPPPQEPAATVVSPETVQSIRESYQRANPNARVGRVVAVHPEANLAAISDIDKKDIKTGDPITFINGDQEILVNGRVEDGVEFLNAKYETPKPGQRAPREGDLAVWVK